MRLLNVATLEFAKFDSQDDIPKYVVASHRWAGDAEATFKEVRESRHKTGAGYKKVEAFAKYVRETLPDIQWLWIDTCCINRDSEAELSEAVNSMFRWYRNAEVCIAYLADVEGVVDSSSFGQSQWFRRGWTLQELLAPRVVVFLTRGWDVIGFKGPFFNHINGTSSGPDLAGQIARITGIPKAVLNDYGTSVNLRIEEKMQWMEGRRTTREEDTSYALFGIVGVTPGANYGEGGDGARQRLHAAIRQRDGADVQRVAALHNAVRKDDAVSVRRLIRRGADVSKADERGLTPLHLAASYGLEQMVLLLLRLGAPVEPADDNGQTPLHKAILGKHFILARKLEQKGADPTVEDDNGNKPADLVESPFLSHWCGLHGYDLEARDGATGNTALIEAVSQGDLHGTVTLIKLGADLSARNANGSTALAEACIRGHIAVATELLQHLADPNAIDNARWSPFTRCIWAQQEEMMKLLLDSGRVLINEPYTSSVKTPLMEAIYCQQWDVVKTLLIGGADPNKRGPGGDSPLRRACQTTCQPDVIEAMIDHGADFHSADPDGWTALAEAIHHRSWAVIELLLDRGAQANCLVYGKPPLFELMNSNCDRTETSKMRLLVKHGAKVDATTDDGATPLHEAVHQAHSSSVAELLSLGADPNRIFQGGGPDFADHEHITVLQHSVWRSQEWYGASFRPIVSSLLKHGARLEDRDSFGWTALRIAVDKGYDAVACFLFLRGADIRSVALDGQTPAGQAERRNLPQFSRLSRTRL